MKARTVKKGRLVINATSKASKRPPTPEQMYKELEKIWVLSNNLKPGMRVTVIGVPKNEQFGWDNFSTPAMNKHVGKTFVVKHIASDGSGIQLDNDYFYPFFVLEVLHKPELPKIKINSEYTAEIQEDGSVKVGCTTVSYDKLNEIFDAAWEAAHNSL